MKDYIKQNFNSLMKIKTQITNKQTNKQNKKANYLEFV